MKKNWIAILIALFIMGSCSDVFEIAPQDKISGDDVWQDETLIRLYINACYTEAFEQGLFRNTQIGHATDELHSIKGSVWYKIITRGELSPDNVGNLNDFLNNWKPAYATIRNINIFFEQIDAVTMDDTEKEEMKGEMTFIRAFLYAQLINRYGGVPLVKNVFALDSDFSIERSSYDECVSFIVSELDNSINMLPAKQDAALGRVSGDAAKALKSRVLLYAASPMNNPENNDEKWEAASNAALALIDNGYGLSSDYQKLFLGEDDQNEIIFARYFTQSYRMALSMQVGRINDNGWGSDSPTQNLVDGYEMSNGQFPFLEDGTVNEASGYDPSNPYLNRDSRFYASILHDGSIWMGRETECFVAAEGSGLEHGKDSKEGPIGPWNHSQSRYYLKKFVPEDIPPTGGTVFPTTPWIMLRYAEVLLNYAEAQFMLGNESVARDYINMVRARNGVNMPEITESGDDLKKRIYHERRIELVFESHRFFDVRRWKISNETETKNIMGVDINKLADGSKTYEPILLIERHWEEKFNLLPIPRVEIDRSLGVLTQNPDYN